MLLKLPSLHLQSAWQLKKPEVKKRTKRSKMKLLKNSTFLSLIEWIMLIVIIIIVAEILLSVTIPEVSTTINIEYTINDDNDDNDKLKDSKPQEQPSTWN